MDHTIAMDPVDATQPTVAMEPVNGNGSSEPCPHCGTPLALDQRYCLECGAPRTYLSGMLLDALVRRHQASPRSDVPPCSHRRATRRAPSARHGSVATR